MKKILLILTAVLLQICSIKGQTPDEYIEFLNTSGFFYFETNKHEIQPVVNPMLDKLADILINNINCNLEITGHTDNTGTYEHNMELSQRRAEEVKKYLISKGCSPAIITVIPLASLKNVSSSEQYRNRRVEFRLSRTGVNNEETPSAFHVNSSIIPVSGKELKIDAEIVEKNNELYRGLKQEDITANLSWYYDDKEFTTDGKVKLIPINDRKKIAASIVMDYSGGMYEADFSARKNVAYMESAVKIFLNICGNNVYGKLVKFGTAADHLSEYTANLDNLKNLVEEKSFWRDRCALLRTVYYEVRDNPFASNPAVMKTVIVFGSMKDNESIAVNTQKVIRKANELGIKIFAIGLYDSHYESRELMQDDERELYDIADGSGGMYHYNPEPASLEALFRSIITNVMNSYTISIIWNGDTLPPKGTMVKAVVKVKVKNEVKTFIKDYIMPD